MSENDTATVLSQDREAALDQRIMPLTLILDNLRSAFDVGNEALGPLGPAAGGVSAVDREHRSPLVDGVGLFKVENFMSGNRPHTTDIRYQVAGLQVGVDIDHIGFSS